jgi:iron(III) transport system substrate-binding protein
MKQTHIFGSLLFTLALSAGAATAQTFPAGYPVDYAATVAKAKQEGTLSIYTATDQSQAKELLEAFKAMYPGIAVEYNDLGNTGAFNRAVSEAAAKQVGADLIWTSAMDLQLALVEKGLTDSYKSPELPHLPAWAIYKDSAYGTTIEPAAIIYNKALFTGQLPRTRAELTRMLVERKDLDGKVGSFDPEKSGAGFLYFSFDSRNSKDFWSLARAFGTAHGKVYGSSGAMKEKVLSGEHVLAFEVIGSYALDWAKKNPGLGVAFTTDYTPALSRVAVIAKGAKHPNAARLFLDFLLSEKGQKILATRDIPSVRSDIDGLNLSSLNKMVGGNLKPIPVDKSLVEANEPKRRVEFLQEWKKALNK